MPRRPRLRREANHWPIWHRTNRELRNGELDGLAAKTSDVGSAGMLSISLGSRELAPLASACGKGPTTVVGVRSVDGTGLSLATTRQAG